MDLEEINFLKINWEQSLKLWIVRDLGALRWRKLAKKKSDTILPEDIESMIHLSLQSKGSFFAYHKILVQCFAYEREGKLEEIRRWFVEARERVIEDIKATDKDYAALTATGHEIDFNCYRY